MGLVDPALPFREDESEREAIVAFAAGSPWRSRAVQCSAAGGHRGDIIPHGKQPAETVSFCPRLCDNAGMNANETIPAEILAELRAATERAAKGVRDPEVMRRACERMDRMREELRRRAGDVDIAVELIREVRDES